MSFKDDNGQESQQQHYLLTVEIKSHVMIDRQNSFDQPIKNDLKHMITLERLQLVKLMITQHDVY